MPEFDHTTDRGGTPPERDAGACVSLAVLLDALRLPADAEADEYAPPVDPELVEAYVDGEPDLRADERAMVLSLVTQFRTWRQALADALLRRGPTQP
jgi:hypothetical protein